MIAFARGLSVVLERLGMFVASHEIHSHVYISVVGAFNQ